MRLRRRRAAVSTGRRRRQAVDGPKGSPAFAYRSSRAEQDLNLGRGTTRTTRDGSKKDIGRFLMRRFGLVLLLVALLVSAVNALSLSGQSRLVTLDTPGSSPFLHSSSEYRQTADRLLGASVWNRNKITVDTGTLRRQMLKTYPELSDVSVTLPLLSRRPVVYIQTAKTALILSADNGSFVIDTSGKALLNADNLDAGARAKLPVVRDQSGIRVSINRQALSSAEVAFISTVKQQLSARHASVSSMVLPAAASELDIHISGEPYTIKFNLQSGDARQQAGTFLATRAYLQRSHETPAQYVDVRVDGRAYYR